MQVVYDSKFDTNEDWQALMGRRSCLACRQNRHKMCDLHMNDGAVDIEEYINVRCGCPCRGQVREEGGKLIELVADLRDQYSSLLKQLAEKDRNINRLMYNESEALSMLKDFFNHWMDDEGGLNGLSKSQRWEDGLMSMHEQYVKMLDGEPDDENDEDADDEGNTINDEADDSIAELERPF